MNINRRLFTLVVVLITIYNSTSSATIIRVPGDSPTIQHASNLAEEGDTVLIADGIYDESINIYEYGITIASHYILDMDLSHANNTVIETSPNRRIIDVDESVTTSVEIIALTLENSDFTYEDGRGSAVFASHIDISIKHCYINNNSGFYGAVYLDSCSVYLYNNVFSNNFGSLMGSAGNITDSNAEIVDNIFNNNLHNHFAAGLAIISNIDASINIHGNQFLGNNALHGAGALYLGGGNGTVTINDNYFAGNASERGGAIYVFNVDSLIVKDNIFRSNRADGPEYLWPNGAAIFISHNLPFADIHDNEFYYNTSVCAGAAIATSSQVLFHHNLLFKNEGTGNSIISTFNGMDNDNAHAIIQHNLLYKNSIYDPPPEYDYGCVGVSHPMILTALNNDFYGNTNYAAGLNDNPNHQGDIFLANNYWGDPTGPYHPEENPSGLGDPVKENVSILPFATEPFTTRWLRAPEPVGLIEPSEGEFLDNDTITFLWHAAADSTPHDTLRYSLHLADNPDFIDALVIDSDLDTSTTIDNFEWEALYYWKVVARDIYDLETSSLERQFMVTRVDEHEFDGLPTEWAIERIFPNPFNRAVQVIIAVPNPDHVRIEVFDLQGRLVETLHSGNLTPGLHRAVWQPNTATGMYFLRVSAGHWMDMRKIVYLK
jgi:Right handed beta helix region/Secretion system C-terminal sorting domain